MTPPSTPVRIATVLWFAAAALGLAGQFVPPSGVPAEQAGVNPVALVLLGFIATVTPRMRAGHNWARILLTVLGVGMLSLTGYALPAARATAATGPLGVLAVALLVGFLLLLAVGLVLMYLPGTGGYFARARVQR